jgi:uncharacterized protein YndB with AHSA1/START domain
VARAIALSVPVGASPDVLYRALTESAGLASFWTSDSHAEPVVGSVGRFGFPTGSRVDLRIEELEPGQRVVWTMLSDTLQGPPWKGTAVTWELRPIGERLTEVLFQQTNWAEDVVEEPRYASLAAVTYAWAQILRALKGYAETGTPQPHFAGVAAR